MASKTNPQLLELASEIVTEIFKFVRGHPDLKNLCLVSKKCREYAAPLLWRTLTCRSARMNTSRWQALKTLLRRDNGILSHVRAFRFKLPTTSAHQAAINTEGTLIMILMALPHNSLLEFRADYEIGIEQLLVLFQTQRQLRKLSLDFTQMDISFALLSGSVWENMNVPKLKFLQLSMPERNGQWSMFFGLVNFLMTRLSGLRELHMNGNMFKGPPLSGCISLPQVGRPPPFGYSALQSLHLSFRSYPDSRIFSCVDFPQLSELSFYGCHKQSEEKFFIDLSLHFSSKTPKLRKFQLVRQRDCISEETLQAIETFLYSFSSLRELEVDLGTNATVHPSCVTQHASTLRVLRLHGAERDATDLTVVEVEYYAFDDFAAMLRSCEKLEQLAMNVYPISHDVTEHLDADKSPYHLQTPLEAWLTTLARHPRLHTLSITAPKSTFASPDTQQIATGLMKFLVSRGSKLKVLAVANQVPRLRWGSAREKAVEEADMEIEPKDEQDEQAVFVKATLRDITGKEEVLAVPVADWKTVMPESTVLGYAGEFVFDD